MHQRKKPFEVNQLQLFPVAKKKVVNNNQGFFKAEGFSHIQKKVRGAPALSKLVKLEVAINEKKAEIKNLQAMIQTEKQSNAGEVHEYWGEIRRCNKILEKWEKLKEDWTSEFMEKVAKKR